MKNIPFLAMLIFSVVGIIRPASSAEPVIRIAADKWTPYEDISNKKLPGFSTELIQLVFAELGKKIELTEYPWARALASVSSGDADALYTAFYDEERARFAHYPKEPLARDKWVFFIRKEDVGRLSFSSYEDLKGKRIGVLRGASVSAEFWNFVKNQKNVEEVPTDDLNFKKLAAGRIDYAVTSLTNGLSLIKSLQMEDQVVPLIEKSIKDEYLYIIFSKKTISLEFVSEFSNALKKVKQTNAYKNIYKKYF